MKKGFTLVELLAVIVILSILALIISPLVINLINEAEVGAELRSAELYVNAVEHDLVSSKLDNINVEDGIYPIMNDGNLCLGSLVNNECDGSIFEIKATGVRPIKGAVTVESKVVTDAILKYEETNIRMLEKGIFEHKDPVCFAIGENENTFGTVPTGNYLPGDEYMCKLNSDTTYRFMVLSVEGENVNLIMERNIGASGGLTVNRDDSVQWASYDDYSGNDYYWYGDGSNLEGPVTAMKLLYDATKDWTNIDNIIMDYTDEGNNYGQIYTEGTTTKMTRKNGTVTATYENLKARMPEMKELTDLGCIITGTGDTTSSCPNWLANYITFSSTYCPSTYTREEITGFYGYWTLSSSPLGYTTGLTMYCSNSLRANRVDMYRQYGVRPVITVSKYLIEENN